MPGRRAGAYRIQVRLEYWAENRHCEGGRPRASVGRVSWPRSWIGSAGMAWRQTTGSRRLVRSGDVLSAGLSEAGWPGEFAWLRCRPAVGTSTSAGLVRITTRDTTSASTAKTAASWKAVEMPWARTWWAYCGRKLTGLLELGLELGGGVGQELADLVGGLVAAGGAEHGDQDGQAEGAADLLGDIQQAGGRPRLVRRARPETATIVRGTNSRPMPRPNSSMGPRIPST